jgi:hypothetical protein
MINIKFRDIDPDTGNVSQEKTVATCESPDVAKVIVKALSKWQSSEPNREFFSINAENTVQHKPVSAKTPAELEEEVRAKAMSTSPSPMPRNNGYTPFGSGEMKY